MKQGWKIAVKNLVLILYTQKLSKAICYFTV